MLETRCPFCSSIQKRELKKWKYGKVNVRRFKCQCGKFFNFYQRGKSTWTIPKK